MESTITSHSTAQNIEKPLFKVFHPVVTETNEQEAKIHKGYSIGRFLWIYTAIFTGIMCAVIIAERFFFVS